MKSDKAMQAKAHVRGRPQPNASTGRNETRNVWERFVGLFVMDEPGFWSEKPDVDRILAERKAEDAS
jgi:hypothetical protein